MYKRKLYDLLVTGGKNLGFILFIYLSIDLSIFCSHFLGIVI